MAWRGAVKRRGVCYSLGGFVYNALTVRPNGTAARQKKGAHMDAPAGSAILSYIGGSHQRFGDGGMMLVTPQHGAVVGEIDEAGEAGVARAVASAHEAYLAHRTAPLHKRIGWLMDAARALEEAAEEFAALICEDVGKPLRLSRFEARRGAEFLRACAAAAPQLNGEVLPLDAAAAAAGTWGLVRRVPYGVVAAITPFNAPINLIVQKLAPAIVAGNAVVAKASPAGTRASVRLAELLVQAGWPAGLFNVVTGDRETAVALVSHELVRAVSFTGGTVAGDALVRAAGAKKFVAELGSNAANIVLADADLGVAAAKIAGAGFEASGQQCISAQRVLVQRGVLDGFLPLLVAAAGKLKVGPAADAATDIGPMVHEASARRVMDMVADAKAHGAREVLAATREGATVSPGILLGTPREARLWNEEVFGPVVIVQGFDDVSEALRLANDSRFGLQGAVFTSSLANMMRFAEEFDVGSLWVNEASRFRVDSYPFGGVKASGIGREGVRYAIEEMSQLKFIGIRA
jgi:acyl-CoA reductase-like NAD-dependent aldehyde dehydrogenase